jgi:hypothetical protein
MNHPVHDRNNDISIRLKPNGVSFSIREKTGNELFRDTVESTVASGTDAIRETILSSGILEKPYNRVTITVPTPLFTLFPEEAFDPEQIDLYYAAAVGDPEGKRVLFQHIKELRLILLFALDEALHDFLTRSFIHPEIEHHLSSLLPRIVMQPSAKEGNTVYVAYDAQLLSILLFKDGRFFSASAYRCNTANDALYYVLSVWKQFGYDQLNDKLYIVGDGAVEEELLRQVSTYVEQSSLLLTNKEWLCGS